MNFSIVGANRDTGEDVQTIVPARDRQDAERWASEHGIMWTSIIPVAIPVKYAAEKDGVIWLIGCIGILLSLLIWGPQIDFSDATHLGGLLGSVLGTFILIFLFGLIGSKIAGKRTGPSRIGFASGALLVLVAVAVGEYRIRQVQRANDIQAVSNSTHAMLDEIRGTSTRPSSAAHSSAGNSSGSTINDLSASEAADTKLLMAEMQKFLNDAKATGDRFQKRMLAIIGDGIIRPQDLDTADHIASTKRRLLELRQMLDERDKAVDVMYDSLPTRINALPVAQALKDSAIQGYYKTGRPAREIVRQISDTDRQFVSDALEMAEFMRSRLGHFEVKDGRPLFNDDADVKAYNVIFARIQDSLAKEGELTDKQQKLTQDSTATMEQFLGK